MVARRVPAATAARRRTRLATRGVRDRGPRAAAAAGHRGGHRRRQRPEDLLRVRVARGRRRQPVSAAGRLQSARAAVRQPAGRVPAVRRAARGGELEVRAARPVRVRGRGGHPAPGPEVPALDPLAGGVRRLLRVQPAGARVVDGDRGGQDDPVPALRRVALVARGRPAGRRLGGGHGDGGAEGRVAGVRPVPGLGDLAPAGPARGRRLRRRLRCADAARAPALVAGRVRGLRPPQRPHRVPRARPRVVHAAARPRRPVRRRDRQGRRPAMLVAAFGAYVMRWIDVREGIVLASFATLVLQPDHAYTRALLAALPFLFLIDLTVRRWAAMWVVSAIASAGVYLQQERGELGGYGSVAHVVVSNAFLVLVLAYYVRDKASARRRVSAKPVGT